MSQVNLYTDASGFVTISRTQSFLVWRKLNISVPKVDPDTQLCKMCGGTEMVNLKGTGLTRCICDIAREEKILSKLLTPIRSNIISGSLDDLQPHPKASKSQNQWLEQTVANLKLWLNWPDSWITIMGGVGNGKSHILSALADHFGNWALYLTESDFEAKLSEIMDQGDAAEISMSDYIDRIKRAPILLYDDAGSGYVKAGKDYARSKLRNIVDFRYMMPEEYPMVVTTNYTAQELRNWDQRIADRILDESLVAGAPRTWVLVNPLPSWRRHADPHF